MEIASKIRAFLIEHAGQEFTCAQIKAAIGLERVKAANPVLGQMVSAGEVLARKTADGRELRYKLRRMDVDRKYYKGVFAAEAFTSMVRVAVRQRGAPVFTRSASTLEIPRLGPAPKKAHPVEDDAVSIEDFRARIAATVARANRPLTFTTS